MKHLSFCALLLLLGSTSFAQKRTALDFKKLEWLSGNWTRINMKPGRTGTESWKKVSPAKLTGEGITMRGKDTIFVEKLSLVLKGNDIYYVAEVSDGKPPVSFKLTHLTDSSFICENPQHDFPTKIAYTLKDGRITAIVSGGDRSEEYIFVK